MSFKIKASLLFLLALHPLVSFAENSKEDFSVNGFFVEATKGLTTCVAVKVSRFPIYIQVRTNRPEVFFEEIKEARRCVREVLKIAQSSKHTSRRIFFEGSLSVMEGVFHFGEQHSLVCKKYVTGNGRELAYEFSFPFMYQKEVDYFVHETPMTMCLNESRPLVSPREENNLQHPSMLPA